MSVIMSLMLGKDIHIFTLNTEWLILDNLTQNLSQAFLFPFTQALAVPHRPQIMCHFSCQKYVSM